MVYSRHKHGNVYRRVSVLKEIYIYTLKFSWILFGTLLQKSIRILPLLETFKLLDIFSFFFSFSFQSWCSFFYKTGRFLFVKIHFIFCLRLGPCHRAELLNFGPQVLVESVLSL